MKKNINNKERKNVYQMVTDKVIERMQQGIIPWHQPWTGASLTDGGAVSYATGKAYSLLNQMLLGREGQWLTFKQVKDAGGSVKKGAKAGMVVFFTILTTTKRIEKDEDGNDVEVQVEKEHSIPVLRSYHVFHIDDCENVPSKEKEIKANENLQPIDMAEDVINGYVQREQKLTFKNNKPSGRAYFSPAEDKVVVPMLNQYEIAEEYYSTAFHELTHSTMQPYRCNRKAENKCAAFGSDDYSREELVAELGSAMLCQYCNLDSDKAFNNSVAYLQGWLKVLKNDNKFIVWAASRAEKAARYIIGEK